MKDLKEIASYTLEALTRAGADQAQCTVARGRTKELNIDGGEISLMRTLLDNQVSMKAIKDGKKGTAAINKFDKAAIDQAAAECIEAAQAGVADDAVTIAALTTNAEFKVGADGEDMDAFYDRITEFLDTVNKEYPKIILEQVISDYSESDSVFMNTNGVCHRVQRGGYYFESMFSAHEGERATSFNSYGSQFSDLSRPIIDVGMQRKLLEQSQQELNAKKFEGKFTGKLLVSPGCLGDFINMALDNFISDTSIIDGTSPWKNALGEKVADGKLTVSMVPLDPRMSGGERITDDGYVSENYDIIKDGVLRDFGLSEYAARKTGNKRAPNTSGCMAIAPGDTPIAEIIKGLDRAILVCRFSGGQPAVNGDFSGVAKNSFLIENGEIKHAVTETMISGNLAAMLNNIPAISKETVEDGSSSLPYALFDGITVSG
ncbi:MAG: TldD/PmbA family protein [Clostridia bacterium]|nr:TldD/PmbA family protein [Clostridia bacterium]